MGALEVPHDGKVGEISTECSAAEGHVSQQISGGERSGNFGVLSRGEFADPQFPIVRTADKVSNKQLAKGNLHIPLRTDSYNPPRLVLLVELADSQGTKGILLNAPGIAPQTDLGLHRINYRLDVKVLAL